MAEIITLSSQSQNSDSLQIKCYLVQSNLVKGDSFQ